MGSLDSRPKEAYGATAATGGEAEGATATIVGGAKGAAATAAGTRVAADRVEEVAVSAEKRIAANGCGHANHKSRGALVVTGRE